MINFVHTGDLHLGLQFRQVSFDKKRAKERRRELWTSFQRIVDYCVEKKKDFLFIAGDLFEHKYFTLGDIKRVRDILAGAAEVNVVIAAGNHDYLNENSLYNQVDWTCNVHIFGSTGLEKKVYDDLNTVVYGYSWNRMEIGENSLFDDFRPVDVDYKKILLIHGDVGYKSNYLPLDLNMLKSMDMDYIALGHIHKPEIFTEKIAYCGCPEPLNFGETGDRGFIEGTIEDDTKIEFKSFSRRRFIDINIKINPDMGYLDIVNKIKNIEEGNKAKDFYRIRLQGLIQNDLVLDDIIEDLKEEFYYIELVNNTSPDYDLDSLEKDYEENIIGQFIKEMKEKGLERPQVKEALYYGLEALLKGRDN